MIRTLTILALLVVINNAEIMNCEVISEFKNQPGVFYAVDQDGYAAAYENATPGERITSVLIRNPFTHYEDDVLWRIDFRENGVEII